MKFSFAANTDIGRVREHNEDSYFVDRDLDIYIVCDGMGGHASGEVASSMAVEITRKILQTKKLVLKAYAKPGGSQRKEVLSLIEYAVQKACETIYQKSQTHSEHRGMGTTLSLLVICGDHGFVAHVGDSRVYLVRGNETHQLSEDHTLVEELKRQGVAINESEHFTNAITRAVGIYESVQVDTFDFDIIPGDQYILCSDGLSHYVDDEEYPSALQEDLNLTCDLLVKMAKQRGGHDNITVIAVRAHALAAQESKEHEVRLKLKMLQNIPLFQYLTYREIVKVLNLTQTQSFAAAQKIITAETLGESMYIVLSGQVSIEKTGNQITQLDPGNHFGEMSLFHHAPRSADVIALKETRCIALEHKQLYDLMRREPELAVKLLWSFMQVMASRLRSSNTQWVSLNSPLDDTAPDFLEGPFTPTERQ